MRFFSDTQIMNRLTTLYYSIIISSFGNPTMILLKKDCIQKNKTA